MNEQIENAIFETVSDVDKWYKVLGLFVEATGASKGIISLRNHLTAELVIPNDVRQELGSPLVYGFSEEEVHSYITKYIECDPWTEIENRYHPDEPYALSTHISLSDLKQNRFWEWLKPQNINDTVVFKIGDSSSKYWVAMNLYYLTGEKERQTPIPDYISEFKNRIQNAWKQGQKIRLSHFKSSYTEYFMEQQGQPSFLINSNREVLQKNQKAERLLQSSDSLFYLSFDNILRPGDNNFKKQLQNVIALLEKKYFSKHEVLQENIMYQAKQVQVSLIGEAESLLGENTALFLLSLHHSADKRLIWKDPLLTPRERELVEILAKGGRVVDFQNHYSLAKSTAHMHWMNVKEKLNIKDRTDIHAAHQIYLQNL